MIEVFADDGSNDDDGVKIPLYLQVLASLNFYGSGSHQRRVGMDAFAIMSQSKVSDSITKISKIIGCDLAQNFIKFPSTLQEANLKKQEFEEVYGIPGTIGLIDCTHIGIANVKKRDEYAYVNRKNFHSINVQAVNINFKFIYILINFLNSNRMNLIYCFCT